MRSIPLLLSLLLPLPAQAFTATVFAPPTNVRVSPGGPVRCSVTQPMTLFFTYYSGEWNYSDGACRGAGGWIHDSQLRLTSPPPSPDRLSGYCILQGRAVPDSWCYR